MRQRAVVSGDAGFIGSAVVRYLIGESKASVLNVDKLTYAVISIRLRPLLIRLTISRLMSCIWQ